MAKNVELLLLQTVESLGIVGDIVKVKPGHARNYLLPMGIGIKPTPTRIEALREARAKAQEQLSMLRQAREELLARMEEVTITMVRSCNDQGVLYGSVNQRDIADSLQEIDYDVSDRSVRLANAIRRVGSYEVPIQFDKDLRTDITVVVEADRDLEETQEEKPQEERKEREYDNSPYVDALAFDDEE